MTAAILLPHPVTPHCVTLSPRPCIRHNDGVLPSPPRHEARTMNRQAGVAWLLILLQAAMFWYMSETILFPILVVLISSPAVWWRRRWEIASGYLPWIDLVLAAGCALRWNLAPYELPTLNSFLSYPLVHAAGQFFLLTQVARLWARRPDRPLPVYLPLLAVLVFICLGDVQLSRYGRMRRMHERATLTLVGLSCLYYSMARRRQEPPSPVARWVRPTASVAVLVVCGLSARAGNSWVLEKWSELDQWIRTATGSRPPPRRQNLMVGFSGQAPLGSMQLMRSTLDQEIALRVISDRPPGYLRGAVFERYTSRGWESHTDWLPMSRSRKPLPTLEPTASPNTPGATPVFLLRESSANTLRPVEIWRAATMDRFTFLPLATSRLEAPTDLLNFDRHSVVSADNLPTEVRLTAWVTDSPDDTRLEPIIQPTLWEPGMPWELDRPEKRDAKLRLEQYPQRIAQNRTLLKLAAEVFADCQTPADKIVAVQRHFATYRYGTEVEVPPMMEPVTYFLLHKPPAHCEYIASATALLLRMAGIPCRYVTGYAGAEYNTFGRYWVVRQSHAHAWVEAYLPDEGWVIVDSTPADHVPPTVNSLGLWQLWDEITLRGQMIRTALAGDGWFSKWLAVKLFFLSLLTTIPGALMSGGLLFLAIRKFRFTRRIPASCPLEPAVIELQRLLAKLDRRLQRLNLEREAHETLHQFAERLRLSAPSHANLRDVAEWYLRYAATRYGMTLQPEIQEALRTELQTVCARLSARQRSVRLPVRT